MAASLVGVLVLAGLLTLTPALDVDRIEVSGQFRTPVQDVAEAGGVGQGSPMVLADLHQAARQVEELPWVESAQVTRSWPATIRYSVREREPAAVVLDGDDRWLAADGEGRIVAALEAAPTDLPVVEGTDTGLDVGALTARADQDAFRVAAALPAAVARHVASVSWNGEEATVHLATGGTVTVGPAEDLAAKGVAMASVLAARDPACVASLDVALPNAPVLTSVPGCG